MLRSFFSFTGRAEEERQNCSKTRQGKEEKACRKTELRKLREEERERRKQEKEEAKEVSHQKNLAETEMKEKNNVKEPNPKGKKQQRAALVT